MKFGDYIDKEINETNTGTRSDVVKASKKAKRALENAYEAMIQFKISILNDADESVGKNIVKNIELGLRAMSKLKDSKNFNIK